MKDENKKIDLKNIKTIKSIKEQVPSDLLPCDEGINKALNDAHKRYEMVNLVCIQNEKKLMERYGIKQGQCFNNACTCCSNSKNICQSKDNLYLDCSFRLFCERPNPWNYDEYMPTWQEALDMLEKNALLKGEREEYQKSSLYYEKAKTQDERQNTEIKGITMAQAEAGIKKAIIEYMSTIKDNDFNTQEEKDEFDSHYDPDVIARNSTLEFEKAMGIYPNIKMR